MGKNNFSLFTNSYYLKGDNGKYCAGYAIKTPFGDLEAASLPMVTSCQQAKLYPLTWTCTLAKDKTAKIYTDSRYAFRVAYDFEMLCKRCGFLASCEYIIKNGPYVQVLLNAILLPAALAITKIQGHSKPDTLDEREITLLILSLNWSTRPTPGS